VLREERVTNIDISKIFHQLADLLEMKGENQFKVRAYRQASRTFKDLPREVEDMLRDGENLEEIPGIGEAIAKKITEIVDTGHLKLHDDLRAGFPEGILDILSIPGIGPRMAMRLHTEAEVGSVSELEAAIRDGRVASMPHMGGKAAQRMLSQINSAKAKGHAC
jgi:DNA polymerase (family 10)